MESNIEAYSVDELMKMFKLAHPLTEYEISSVMDSYKRSKKNSKKICWFIWHLWNNYFCKIKITRARK